MPWQLQMATWCMNTQNGQLIHFPRSGGYWEQDSYELEMMSMACVSYMVFKRPFSKWEVPELNFLSWMMSPDSFEDELVASDEVIVLYDN